MGKICFQPMVCCKHFHNPAIYKRTTSHDLGENYFLRSKSMSEEEQPPRRPLTSGGAQPPVKPRPHKEVNRRELVNGVIATLSGVRRYDTLKIRGIVQGQRAIALVDVGATHNFIDVAWVSRRAL
jgi:hypothetical protein